MRVPQKYIEQEYQDFRAWAIEGSCLPQRMYESSADVTWPIPAYWHELKKLAAKLPDKLSEAPPDIASKFTGYQ